MCTPHSGPATDMNVDWGVRILLPALLGDVRRVWWRLALTGAVFRALSFALLTPAVAFLIRWSLQRGASSAVLTDQGILFFFLSPAGLLTMLAVGSVIAAIYFVEISALLVVPIGALQDVQVWALGALRFTGARAYALLRLALRALLRLLLIAAPFLAIAGTVYWLLLRDYDLYFLTSVKPPVYWVAGALIAPTLACGAALLIRRLLLWTLALPILLFEDRTPREALGESEVRVRSRVRSLAAWHAGWLASGLVLSATTTLIVGLAGRALIRPDAPLAWIALATSLVGSISLLLYFVTLVLSTAIYITLIGRLYWSVRSGPATRRSTEQIAELDGIRWRRSGSGSAGVVALAAAGALVAFGVTLVNRAAISPAAEVTAHRGAKHEAPENTLPAIDRAIELGADWVEIDVQLTADGRVIVVHDRDFIRVAGSNLRAEESRLSELQELDVGAWFGPDFRGVHPPTLEEVLDLCRGRVGVNIELKYFSADRGLASRVIEIVEQRGMADQVKLMSFEHERVAEAKALRPDWEMGLLIAVALGDALRLEADFYAVPPSLATRGFVRAAQRLGRQVHVWTVEDPVRISAMMSRGADNLYTGETEIVRRVIAERAALGPVERLLIDLAADLGVVRVPPTPPASPTDA